MSPRIAYVAGEYPLVSLTFVQREIAALRARGIDVITCSMRRTPPAQHPGPAEREAARTTFHVIEAMRDPRRLLAAQRHALSRPRRYLRTLGLAWRTRPPGLRAALYQCAYFLEATILARHVAEAGVGHMHNHFVTGSATVTMLASELAGIPYSFTLHGPNDLVDPRRWRLDEKTARARFVVAISHYARAQLMIHAAPADWDRIHVVHCGVDPARYAGAATRPDGDIRLLFVGRLAPVKGLRILLAAMARLAGEIPALRLTLVGDGPDRAALEAAAEPLGDRIRFTGYLSQDAVAEALRSADLVVLPSFAEGVPVVLMEAFAAAKPVIATRVAGVAELVEPGISGLLVPPGDADSLAEALRSLAGDPGRRAAMGQAGRARVLAEFDIATEAARLARLYSGEKCGIRPDPL